MDSLININSFGHMGCPYGVSYVIWAALMGCLMSYGVSQLVHLSASIMATHSPVLRSQANRWPQSDPEKMKSFPHHAASWFFGCQNIGNFREIVTLIIVLAFLWPVSFCLMGGRLTLLLWPFCLSSSSSESDSILSKLAWGVTLWLLLRSST